MGLAKQEAGCNCKSTNAVIITVAYVSFYSHGRLTPSGKGCAVRVMPANATGWFWHCLARETGRIGHLFSPNAQRGPYPWFPYALDCGSFSCWDMASNVFDDVKWNRVEQDWWRLVEWSRSNNQKPIWAIMPDVPGDWPRTVARWREYEHINMPCARGIAVQDGATVAEVKALQPDVVCVGGTTEWKWATWLELWVRNFPRVHVLRVNAPSKLSALEWAGVESCDGTGWNRGNNAQTQGIEDWARSKTIKATFESLSPHVCRARPKNKQLDLMGAQFAKTPTPKDE